MPSSSRLPHLPLPLSLGVLLLLSLPLPASPQKMGADSAGNLLVSSGGEQGGQVIINNEDILWKTTSLQDETALLVANAQAQNLSIHDLFARTAKLMRASPRGKLYTLGGIKSLRFPDGNAVMQFDGVRWALVEPLPSSVSNAACGTLGGNMYVIGGLENDQLTDAVHRFNGNRWETLTVRPFVDSRSHATAVVLNGYLYILGGKTDVMSEPITNSVYFTNDPATSWSGSTYMLQRRMGHASVVYKGSIISMGGTNSSQNNPAYLNTAERFTPNPTSVTMLPSFVQPRFMAAAAVFGNNVYLVGGLGPNNVVLASVEVFNGTAWAFQASSLNTARHSHGLTVFNGVMYVIGGIGNAGEYLVSTERFNGTQWLADADLPSTRAAMGVTALGW